MISDCSCWACTMTHMCNISTLLRLTPQGTVVRSAIVACCFYTYLFRCKLPWVVAGKSSIMWFLVPSATIMGWWRWTLISPDGVVPSRMVGVPASVNLPLHHEVQKFSSGTGSPGWSRKKGCKTVVVCGGGMWFLVCYVALFIEAIYCCTGSKVSDTIRKGIIDITPYQNESSLLMVGNVAALSGQWCWCLASLCKKMNLQDDDRDIF